MNIAVMNKLILLKLKLFTQEKKYNQLNKINKK